MEDIVRAVIAAATAAPGDVLLRRQLVEDLDLSPHEIVSLRRSGVLVPVARGAYVVGGHVPDAIERLAGASQVAAPGRDAVAVVSHRSAAVWWALRGVVALQPEVTVIGRGRNDVEGAIVHRTDVLADLDLVRVGRLWVTSPPRTLFDLGAVCPIRTVERALEDAIFRKLATFHSCREVLERCRGRGRRGAAALAAILDARDPALAPPESELELRFLRLIKRAGLAPEGTQTRVVPPVGVVRFLVVSWVSVRLGAVVDGHAFHGGREELDRDRVRSRMLRRAGWDVASYGWAEVVREPQRVIADLKAHLGRT
jgi:hypothetical protein